MPNIRDVSKINIERVQINTTFRMSEEACFLIRIVPYTVLGV